MQSEDLIDAFVHDAIQDLKKFQSYWLSGFRSSPTSYPLIKNREQWEVEFNKWLAERTGKHHKKP